MRTPWGRRRWLLGEFWQPPLRGRELILCFSTRSMPAEVRVVPKSEAGDAAGAAMGEEDAVMNECVVEGWTEGWLANVLSQGCPRRQGINWRAEGGGGGRQACCWVSSGAGRAELC